MTYHKTTATPGEKKREREEEKEEKKEKGRKKKRERESELQTSSGGNKLYYLFLKNFFSYN